MRQVVLSVFLLIGWTLVQAASVVGVRMWPAPDNTRLVFDLNAPIEHNLFVLEHPERIVIDLKATELKASPLSSKSAMHAETATVCGSSSISSVRSRQRASCSSRRVNMATAWWWT